MRDNPWRFNFFPLINKKEGKQIHVFCKGRKFYCLPWQDIYFSYSSLVKVANPNLFPFGHLFIYKLFPFSLEMAVVL